MKQPPEEILSHAYEYSVREDIPSAMETAELSDAQAESLLNSPCPLAVICQIWEKYEDTLMEEIRSVIRNCADALTGKG